jgi:pimeloyl-ACP methyl ester carboxylesterase
MTSVEFIVDIPDDTLDDLQRRLTATRWPLDFENDDWRYGTRREYLEELVDYWRTEYDWRAQERAMNEVHHFRTAIDDVPIHFIHEYGEGPNPIPLILSHGWPWTFWDFAKTIRPLTHPSEFGGDPRDAFDVVVPSLPGFGFSTPLTRSGLNVTTTADMWVTLMRDELGYDRFGAQGGDWGHWVSAQMGHKYPEHLIGIHLNIAVPLDFMTAGVAGEADYVEDEKQWFEHSRSRMAHATTHVVIQGAEPQTIAYGLNDSPVALLAWMLDRRRWWSDCDGDVEKVFTKDELITSVMVY